jgi:hypothetical protein
MPPYGDTNTLFARRIQQVWRYSESLDIADLMPHSLQQCGCDTVWKR